MPYYDSSVRTALAAGGMSGRGDAGVLGVGAAAGLVFATTCGVACEEAAPVGLALGAAALDVCTGEDGGGDLAVFVFAPVPASLELRDSEDPVELAVDPGVGDVSPPPAV